jgi:hypothetical protein
LAKDDAVEYLELSTGPRARAHMGTGLGPHAAELCKPADAANRQEFDRAVMVHGPDLSHRQEHVDAESDAVVGE